MPNPEMKDDDDVPIIDLSCDSSITIPQIVNACSTWGFFQVINHSIPLHLISSFRQQMTSFFSLPYTPTKHSLFRTENNARGYFNNELTKQRRDWKECLDVGVPGSRDWDVEDDDDDGRNACLDGFNRFPDRRQQREGGGDLREFRSTVVDYFEACVVLSDVIANLMARGLLLGCEEEMEEEGGHSFLREMRETHTSYLRMNHYPPCRNSCISSGDGDTDSEQQHPLGISPHRDAGFLTVLVQDDDCHSLQVIRPGTEDEWMTVRPAKGAITINTGDMAMIWSNGKYKAPLHRVLTNSEKHRYSAPFFYNPGYRSIVQPLAGLISRDGYRRYRPCSWGYFRAVRFAGDLTDLGTEIQTSDYEMDSDSQHFEKQGVFLKQVNFHEPFSVEKYRLLLEVK